MLLRLLSKKYLNLKTSLQNHERMRALSILLDLFLTFAKIGLFTFGGGYAMISMIEHNCVDKKAWLSHDELMNVTVIAESTPGPIAINCAMLAYKKAAKKKLSPIGLIVAAAFFGVAVYGI